MACCLDGEMPFVSKAADMHERFVILLSAHFV